MSSTNIFLFQFFHLCYVFILGFGFGLNDTVQKTIIPDTK